MAGLLRLDRRRAGGLLAWGMARAYGSTGGVGGAGSAPERDRAGVYGVSRVHYLFVCTGPCRSPRRQSDGEPLRSGRRRGGCGSPGHHKWVVDGVRPAGFPRAGVIVMSWESAVVLGWGDELVDSGLAASPTP